MPGSALLPHCVALDESLSLSGPRGSLGYNEGLARGMADSLRFSSHWIGLFYLENMI